MKALLLAVMLIPTFASAEVVMSLGNGATLEAQDMRANNYYSGLKVRLNGKSYDICRYESAALGKFLCRDSRAPYAHISSTTLGWLKKSGVAISASKGVSVVECYNKVVYEGLACATEPY